MSSEFREPGAKGAPQARVKSCGKDESGYPEAVGLLAVWILEDIQAIAESYGVERTSLIQDVLDRVQRDVAFFGPQGPDAEGQ